MRKNKDIRCVDCDGWAIDGGSCFVGVILIHKGKRVDGLICELCWLKRLQRRGNWVNRTSSSCSQVDLPELGILKCPPPPKPKPRPVIPPPRPRPRPPSWNPNRKAWG